MDFATCALLKVMHLSYFFVEHHILCIRVYAEAHLEFPTKILQDEQIFI